MTITTTTDIVHSGVRNLIMQFTGISDGTGNENNVIKVVANGATIKIRHLSAEVTGGVVTLSWANTIPQVFAQLTGYKNLDYKFMGGLINRSGGNGDILLSTSGFGLNSAYTIKLEMVIDAPIKTPST